MQNVILVIHIFACIAMTILVLLQRSEGGALGIGGGGGGLMSGRGAAGALVRTTMIFGGIFFLTSLALTTIANRGAETRTEVERALEEDAGGAPATRDDLLEGAIPLFDDPLLDPGVVDTPPVDGAAAEIAGDDATPPADPLAADDDPLSGDQP